MTLGQVGKVGEATAFLLEEAVKVLGPEAPKRF